jgi:hypothetical protein
MGPDGNEVVTKLRDTGPSSARMHKAEPYATAQGGALCHINQERKRKGNGFTGVLPEDSRDGDEDRG